jgi:hypothetical protein
MRFLANRHEMLRTTFGAGENGPVQIIHPRGDLTLAVYDLTEVPDPSVAARELMAQQTTQQLNLLDGPLVRFTLIKTGDNEHQLMRVVHHILYDGWSWKLYFDELASLYDAKVTGHSPPLPPSEELQYADYACWQRKFFHAEAPACQNMIAWWKTKLDSSPEPLDWPVRRSKSEPAADVEPAEGYLQTGISAETWHRMADIASQQNVTLFIVWLAAFSAFLYTQTGQPDIIIGSYVSNRKRSVLQNMFGDFSNLVTLRLRCEPDKTLRTWIMTTRDILRSAIAHSEVPYEELRRSFERDGRTLPAIRTIFLIDSPERPLQFAGLDVAFEGEIRSAAMPWGFTLRLAQRFCDCQFSFDASIYDPAAVRAISLQWKSFVDILSCHPDLPIEQRFMASLKGPVGRNQ